MISQTLKLVLIVPWMAFHMFLSASHAIEIADGFTYGGTNGFAASRALATDFVNYPVFEAVGGIYTYFGTNTGMGSATLLNNEWLLTAGHNWKIGVITNMVFVWDGVQHAVEMSSLIQHPLWTNAPPPLYDAIVSESQGWDIALFRLESPITNNIIFPKLYTKSDEFGKVGITLGAGQIGTGTTPWYFQTNDPEFVYAAANVIDRTTIQTNSGYGGGFLVTDFDSGVDDDQNTLGQGYHPGGDPWTWAVSGSNTTTNLNPAGDIAGTNSDFSQMTFGTNIVEGATAPGDSGGPTFIEDEGEWKLAGITSWGINPWDKLSNGQGFRGLYGDANYYTRVSEHTDWIYSVIPEPTTKILLTLGVFLSALGLWRKNRTRI